MKEVEHLENNVPVAKLTQEQNNDMFTNKDDKYYLVDSIVICAKLEVPTRIILSQVTKENVIVEYLLIRDCPGNSNFDFNITFPHGLVLRPGDKISSYISDGSTMLFVMVNGSYMDMEVV